ncbi:succinylglutamate desuccinylase/aspartoacylase family protein [Nodosilinea sp. LEGE 06152]|uniref:succinylglutamate desuccinylase/aspartoacylase family protein n=1 Tax=Nodosilinea sp. LEGE 06152 TaxID=2777966 RepID=UPI0018805E05|nr:succinylglutamate desuccinylase/aspartoacylase family protein [Nodosilinea sp. LEGE 06152]MBE9157967.1 succinylglutamate desuccinylase/aspartoacylase family protein [Nodosilinea sp. LEGE 06152]
MTTLINPSSIPNLEKTVYTGDILQGVPVISHLGVGELAPGQCHRFFFEGVQMGTGQHWYVPVVVAKGNRSGPCVGLVAGIHGDEVSGIDAVQRVMAQLDPTAMAGSVVAVLGVSRPAVEYTRSHWLTAQGGGSQVDMNRVWPGNEAGATAATRHAGLLWNRLLINNVDMVIDYHTVTTGSDFTLFLFADLRQPTVRQMAELFPAEQMQNDPGLAGTLETALVEAGIPAMTVEIGGPRRFDPTKIAGAVEGTLNVLKHYGLVDGPLGRTAAEVGTVVGDALETIRATTGGFLEMLVDLRDRVIPGQPIARQRNAFGDVVAEYRAGVMGEVAVVARDAVCEPGSRVVQILYSQGATVN